MKFIGSLEMPELIQEYQVKTYFITKYTPKMSFYKNVKVLSEKEFMEKELKSL